MCQTRECRPNDGAPWFFFFFEENIRCVFKREWAMRLQSNECTMRLWDEWTMRFKWMGDAFTGEWVYDAFMGWMDGAFKSEWMYDAFMEWMGDAFMCVFFFLSLCDCCGYVDMKCHAPMRPMFAAQWSEVSILYPGIQFALFIWGSTASWLVEVPPDYCQSIEHWLPMMCLPIGSLSFHHLTMLHLCQCMCLCVWFFFHLDRIVLGDKKVRM